MSEAILLGVPKVEYGAGGITPFPMCLKSCANYLGMDVGYDYLMAACGAAFRLTWNTQTWDGGAVGTFFTFDDPAKIFHLGIESLGCEFEMVSRSQVTKKQEFIDFIVQKIDAGVPVIARGVIGPPEECIITGYRDGGNTLLGWNFFQDNIMFNGGVAFDESGYFITDKWWENPYTSAVMALGEAMQGRFLPKTVLSNAIEVMTGRVNGSYAKGIAAYDAWAKAILSDSEFSENSVMPIMAERLMCHGDAMDCIADGRYNAASYIKSLALPAHQELLNEAAVLFEKVSATFWKMTKVLGGVERGETEMRMFAKPEVRKQLAEIVYEAKAADETALNIIKKLVEVLHE